MFYVYVHEVQDLKWPDQNAKDAYEHTEWGYFCLNKNFLPEPISKEIKESISKLTKDD